MKTLPGGGEKEKLYIEYLGSQYGKKKWSVEQYEGTFRARFFLNTYSNSSILQADDVINIGSCYGGWTLPKDFWIDRDDNILCAGAGEDISFDCGIAKKYKCNVITIDPTPRAIIHYTELKNAVYDNRDYFTNVSDEKYKYDINKEDFEKIKYFPYGIADVAGIFKFYFPEKEEHVSCSIVNLQNTEKYFEAECLTYLMLLDKLNISEFKMIKLDIEGAEYKVIKSICKSKRLPKILCVDFDEANCALDVHADQRIREIFDLLALHGMLPVWIYGDSVTFYSCK